MAPFSISIEVPARNEVAGLTPSASTTISAGTMPLSVFTPSALPVPTIASSLVDGITLTPASTICFLAQRAISASNALGIIEGAISMTATSRPSAMRFSATSRPMNPAPTITALLTSSLPA